MSDSFVLAGLAPLFVSHVNLSGNRIGCSGMCELSRALRNNKHLQYLDVSSNNLCYLGWNALAEVLIASKHLQELDVSGNCIHRSSPAAEPAAAPQSLGRNSSADLSSRKHTAESICLHFEPLFCRECNAMLMFAASRHSYICIQFSIQSQAVPLELQLLRFKCRATRFYMRRCLCQRKSSHFRYVAAC
jgi:hypothetical protein